MNDNAYTNLRHLFGSYLHQDWPDEFSTADDAVMAFIEREPKVAIQAACKELDEAIPLIAEMETPDQFLCDVLWCFYMPSADGLSTVEWLVNVRDMLKNRA